MITSALSREVDRATLRATDEGAVLHRWHTHSASVRQRRLRSYGTSLVTSAQYHVRVATLDEAQEAASTPAYPNEECEDTEIAGLCEEHAPRSLRRIPCHEAHMHAHLRHQLTTRLIVAALLAGSATLAACGGHQVYDPYYSDNHRWNRTEDGFYRRWEGQTGRTHASFDRRPAAEQHAYFDWRHRQ
jgi:hypothetical protein